MNLVIGIVIVKSKLKAQKYKNFPYYWLTLIIMFSFIKHIGLVLELSSYQ